MLDSNSVIYLLLPLPLECWDQRYAPPHTTAFFLFSVDSGLRTKSVNVKGGYLGSREPVGEDDVRLLKEYHAHA